jgi:hypothetical protein
MFIFKNIQFFNKNENRKEKRIRKKEKAEKTERKTTKPSGKQKKGEPTIISEKQQNLVETRQNLVAKLVTPRSHGPDSRAQAGRNAPRTEGANYSMRSANRRH